MKIDAASALQDVKYKKVKQEKTAALIYLQPFFITSSCFTTFKTQGLRSSLSKGEFHFGGWQLYNICVHTVCLYIQYLW